MSESCSTEECIRGTIHVGTPKGTIEPLHGLQTYITGNRRNPRATIVMYPDVFSHQLINNKLIADAYTRSGEYLVLMPDFFNGDPVPLHAADLLIPANAAKQGTLSKYTGLLAFAPSFVMWSTRHKFPMMNSICNDFLIKLRRATTHKIGMVGFCYGGRFALRAGLECNMLPADPSTGNHRRIPLVDAVVALHPSNLDMPHDVNDPVVPTSIGWGQEDTNTSIKLKYVTEWVHKKNQKDMKGGTFPEVVHQIYNPGRHGFAVRGNPDDPAERKCLEDSVSQVLDWFGKYI